MLRAALILPALLLVCFVSNSNARGERVESDKELPLTVFGSHAATGLTSASAPAQIAPYIKAIPDGSIPSGQTEATNVIVWNAGSDYPYCEIYMTVNNGEQTELGRGHDGKRGVTIRLGSTYVFRMIVYLGDRGEDVREVAKLTVVGRSAQSGTGTLGKRRKPGGAFGAGSGNSGAGRRGVGQGRLSDERGAAASQLILLPFFRDVSVAPRGDAIEISFETMEPSEFFIEVSKQQPVANLQKQTAPGQGLPAAFPRGAQLAAFTLPGLSGVRQKHRATVRSAPGQVLEADALYHYVITAKSPDGGFRRYTGKFANVSRTVTVVWERVKILEDSDPVGCGDIDLWLFVNHGVPGGKELLINNLNDDSACTGSEYVLNHESTVENAPHMLRLVVNGRDDDVNVAGAFLTNETTPLDGPSDDGEQEMNVAKGEFDLNSFELNSSFPFKLISVKPGKGQGDLMFEVYGRVVISGPR